MTKIDAVLPTRLRPTADVALCRVGPANDGGYFVPTAALGATRHLVSMGLGDDWRFEEEFVSLTGATLEVYDHTVTRKFWAKRRLARLAISSTPGRRLPSVRSRATYGDYRRFFSAPNRRHRIQKIGYDTAGGLSIGTALDRAVAHEGIFLKCDIEGWEWRSIADVQARAPKMTGLAVEFHDTDIHLERLVDLVGRLASFSICDVGVNNFAPVSPAGVPHAIELVFVNRSLLGQGVHEGGVLERSGALNNPLGPEIRLSFSDHVRML